MAVLRALRLGYPDRMGRLVARLEARKDRASTATETEINGAKKKEAKKISFDLFACGRTHKGIQSSPPSCAGQTAPDPEGARSAVALINKKLRFRKHR